MTATLNEIAQLAKTLSASELLSCEDTRKLGAAYLKLEAQNKALWALVEEASKTLGYARQAIFCKLSKPDNRETCEAIRDVMKATLDEIYAAIQKAKEER